MSKYKEYEDEILNLLEHRNNTEIAATLLINGTYKEIEAFRRHIAKARGIKPAAGNVIKRKSRTGVY
jgi:metal-responsive CopG/Arc/MetJ family transcriptional regulator